jgi:DNA-binding LacI/PurR family transcriptional regulator
MEDVAERAGVALSTVSYALSGKRPVSDETKQRILKAIDELGYHPNILARGLASKHTKVIALLFPALVSGLSEVQLEFVTNAADVASQQGYALLLWTAPGEDQEILRLTHEGLIEGLVLMEIKLHDPRVETLRELGYPFTMIGHCQDNHDISFVDFDFDQAVRLAVEHLANLGHSHIALLPYSPVPLEMGYGPAVRSVRAFQAAVESGGLQGVVRVCGSNRERGYGEIHALLEEHPSLSALVIANDVLYFGAVQALSERDLRIPQDFSIVAITSRRMAEMTTPTLTSAEMPVAEMGRIGTELLIRQLEGETGEPTQLILPADLTVRQSSGPRPTRLAKRIGEPAANAAASP